MRFLSVRLTREGNSEVRWGLPLHKDPYLHVLVGAPNRAQKFVRIPIGKRLVEEYSTQEEILRGSFLKTKEKGTLVLIEEQPETETRAGVIFHAEPGFRGVSLVETSVEILAAGEIWEPPATKRKPPPGTFTESPAYGIGHAILAIVRPGDVFRITRTGRLYGAPEEMKAVFGEDFTTRVLSLEDQKNEEDAREVNGEVL